MNGERSQSNATKTAESVHEKQEGHPEGWPLNLPFAQLDGFGRQKDNRKHRNHLSEVAFESHFDRSCS